MTKIAWFMHKYLYIILKSDKLLLISEYSQACDNSISLYDVQQKKKQ